MSISQNFPEEGPTLNLNFAGSKVLDPRITFSRSSVGTYMDANGLVATASTDSPRFDHRYVNGEVESLGLLVEESRINQIRNNTMNGASIGTPPTNWIPTNISGLTWSITGTGIDAGVYYVDIRLSGTSSSRPSSPTLAFESESQIPASNGQTWSTSCFIKIVSGTTNNIDKISLGLKEWSGTSYLAGGWSSDFSSSINSSTTNIFSSCRYSYTRTNGNPSTTFLQPYLLVTPNGSAVIDITLRIGMPQTELGAFMTSVIPTSAGISTRGADNVSMTGTNFSDWYNQDEGTVYVSQKLKGVQDDSRNNLVYKINGGGGSDYLYNTKSGDKNIFIFGDGGTNYSRFQVGTDSTDTKTAWAYDVSGDDFKPYCNGIEVTNETATNTPSATSHTQLELGASSGAKYCGHIQQFAYYPKRLTNTQLQNLTK